MSSSQLLCRSIAPLLLICGTAVPWTSARAAAPEQADLAERLLQTGLGLTDSRESMPVAAAVADAAERMIDADARLIRIAADLRLRLGHRDKAIDLLNQYRKLAPGDQLAQVQTIDLLVDRMESADQRAAYLRQVLAAETVPAEVRSHAAVQLANLEAERARDAESEQAIDQALRLNPYNPAALHIRLQRRMSADTPAPQRAAALAAMLQANPMAFGVMGLLADELARTGASEQAIELYGRLMAATEGTPTTPTAEDCINYAALLLGAGQTQPARTHAERAVQLSPGSAEAHFMRVLVARRLGDAAAADAALADARTALTRNVMVLHTRVDPAAPKVLAETPVALPDVMADANALKQGHDPALIRTYEAALGDLVWLEAFFLGRPPAGAVADAINLIAGEQGLTLPRATGFAALAAQQPDEAQRWLAPLADRDVLSRAAMIGLRLKQGEPRETLLPETQQVLTQVPTGLWSATIRSVLGDFAGVAHTTADQQAVVAEAARLSGDWLAFGKNGRSFYVVDIDAVKAQVDVGQPILMTITLQNIGKRALVVGPGGPIDQQVILDATVRGAIEQPFPGAAVARMTGLLVLQPRQRMVTVARVDNPQLFGFLAGNPQVSIGVFVSGVANPMLAEHGIVPGPGGFRSQSRSVIDRRAASFQRPESRAELVKQLQHPSAVERLHALQAVAGNAALLAKEQAEELQKIAAEATAMVQKTAAEDASPTVRAIALQLLAGLRPEAERDQAIADMLAANDPEARLLGALLLMGRSVADRQRMLTPLTQDPDAIIARLATALIALPEPVSPGPAVAPLDEQP